MACVETKYSHERWCLRAFINIAMYPAICQYDEHAFNDMSEESEKNKQTLVNKSLRPVPTQGIVEQAEKKMVN